MNLPELKDLNPGLKLYSVFDPAFAPYGRVLEGMNTLGLKEAMLASPLPEEGNLYTADDPAVHALPLTGELEKTVFGGMPVESGYCNGHGFKLNALEYHKCSEVNWSPSGCVLLMALPSGIHDRMVDSKDVAGFYLPPEILIEVHPLVMHFAPARTEPEGFRCLVVLTEGTNSPLESVDPSLPGEAGMLWMRNKWLLAHPESVPASKGAYIGIRGENLTVRI